MHVGQVAGVTAALVGCVVALIVVMQGSGEGGDGAWAGCSAWDITNGDSSSTWYFDVNGGSYKFIKHGQSSDKVQLITSAGSASWEQMSAEALEMSEGDVSSVQYMKCSAADGAVDMPSADGADLENVSFDDDGMATVTGEDGSTATYAGACPDDAFADHSADCSSEQRKLAHKDFHMTRIQLSEPDEIRKLDEAWEERRKLPIFTAAVVIALGYSYSTGFIDTKVRLFESMWCGTNNNCNRDNAETSDNTGGECGFAFEAERCCIQHDNEESWMNSDGQETKWHGAGSTKTCVADYQAGQCAAGLDGHSNGSTSHNSFGKVRGDTSPAITVINDFFGNNQPAWPCFFVEYDSCPSRYWRAPSGCGWRGCRVGGGYVCHAGRWETNTEYVRKYTSNSGTELNRARNSHNANYREGARCPKKTNEGGGAMQGVSVSRAQTTGWHNYAWHGGRQTFSQVANGSDGVKDQPWGHGYSNTYWAWRGSNSNSVKYTTSHTGGTSKHTGYKC
jgi:hypothetical protein